MRFLKKLLISIYVYLALFAVICMVMWIIRGDEPHTLITAVFSAAGVESVIGGIIKYRESKEQPKAQSEAQSEEKSTEDEEPPRKAE